MPVEESKKGEKTSQGTSSAVDDKLVSGLRRWGLDLRVGAMRGSVYLQECT